MFLWGLIKPNLSIRGGGQEDGWEQCWWIIVILSTELSPQVRCQQQQQPSTKLLVATTPTSSTTLRALPTVFIWSGCWYQSQLAIKDIKPSPAEFLLWESSYLLWKMIKISVAYFVSKHEEFKNEAKSNVSFMFYRYIPHFLTLIAWKVSERKTFPHDRSGGETGRLPFLFCAGVLWEVWREEVRDTVVQVSDSPCSSLFSWYFSGPNLRPVNWNRSHRQVII